MGNCVDKSNPSSTAEIAPCDFVKTSETKTSVTVRLYGSATSTLTAYIRFALVCKAVTVRFVPTGSTTIFGPELPFLEVGSDIVSGPRETLIRYIDTKFPQPPQLVDSLDGFDEPVTLIARALMLQHRSLLWHLERMVRWVLDLTTRGGKKIVDPTVGSPRMEFRKFWNSYSNLLELMLEHAQMEERIVFSILDKADRGICKVANEEHARDLPIMNGIKEDIKAIGVLDSGSAARQEALSNLCTRLKSLQERCKEHFKEEERDVLPLIEALELSKEKQMGVLEKCFAVMQLTHSRLFSFLVEGLLPLEAMQYLDLIISCRGEEEAASTLNKIFE
ncbi:hypothetical protein HS088_TW21G01568 [Tripterygium wilfordii]|uniref:Hemerythrin-like domain-containing protein n=1 Tax=Tripterygium wilfordii TaxID=458696 RepID=A0A7J7C5J7_TRIWF|nr:uncharacterized protein LOC119988589 [Tripterygium wilfordii]KAF5729403.1 hypothetical protein HS088_TW21G01568 [Tripterygium wilfordii]